MFQLSLFLLGKKIEGLVYFICQRIERLCVFLSRIRKLEITGVAKGAFTCIIRAEDMTAFRTSLSMLLENLGNTFNNSPRLEKRDIELGEISPGQGYTDYPIKFELRLG